MFICNDCRCGISNWQQHFMWHILLNNSFNLTDCQWIVPVNIYQTSDIAIYGYKKTIARDRAHILATKSNNLPSHYHFMYWFYSNDITWDAVWGFRKSFTTLSGLCKHFQAVVSTITI